MMLIMLCTDVLLSLSFIFYVIFVIRIPNPHEIKVNEPAFLLAFIHPQLFSMFLLYATTPYRHRRLILSMLLYTLTDNSINYVGRGAIHRYLEPSPSVFLLGLEAPAKEREEFLTSNWTGNTL